MNTISQPGGSAYGRCEKHQVPLIHTITESVLCAVCEADKASQWETAWDEVSTKFVIAMRALCDIDSGFPDHRQIAADALLRIEKGATP